MKDGVSQRSLMIAYASRTGSKRNLAMLQHRGWRLLLSPAGVLRTEGMPYALDNGAWSSYCHGQPFDERAFSAALRRFGAEADWTVLPDIVAGGPASLTLSLRWMRRVLEESPHTLLAVQDGLTPDDVVPFLGKRVGIFVGGSTDWKLTTLPMWGALGRQVGCWVHVGRVNSQRRIARCASAQCTSFDGSSASRYIAKLPRLDHARLQLDFGWGV